ncbi:Calx-beta domain-containing protein [uncultured Kordia sp.]|uniref:Calx-beta domain-containing protein n=1 Tax=uncultured Kordia sp. TaxID=507699 RepID=UPI002636F194|nr:Calx-beta domain-containing protein [uncultured Kordia sp.]
MKKIISLVFSVLVLSFFSCENDDNATTIPTENPEVNINFEENFGNAINARFLGRVVNEQNEPIQGATIRVGGTVTTTDIFGIFSVSDVNAFEKFAYITAEKDGYIIGSRAMAPSATEINRVEIMLLKEDVIATINSGQQATVNLPNGTEVTFDGNFTDANGASYSGDVKVILKHLSPDDENMEAMMPGMLFAQDASGDAVALETYGMLAVELKGGADQELQLAEGSTSQISMPLAANTTNPPATIPLWHFDETEGYWVEEGEATLQGNKYVGEVSHFSFWNYDYPYPSVFLCIELQDENGNPMSYAPLDLYSSLLNSTGTYGYTNGNGVECGLVPSGEELTVIVPGVSCANEPFTTTIGPFTSDATVVVTVNSQNQNTSTITGTFVTCDGANVTDGYMQLYINGNSEIIPVSDGTISYTASYCGTLDYSIKGIDVANNQVTEIITGTLNGDATVDLGTLSSCTGFVDSDGDGIFDSFEDLNGDNDLTNDDTDQDSIPNYLDEDDDGDGINTADEDYDGDNDPTNDDTDEDGIPNYLDAQDVIVYGTEVAGTGCDPLVFNLDDIVTANFNGPGTANMSYVFYENEADATSETNPITTPTYETDLASVLTTPGIIFIKGTSTITGQSAVAMVYLFYDFLDTDQDGLTDCEETTGVDIPGTPLVPNGTSDPNDPNDPNVQPDTTLIVDSFSVSESAGTIMIPVSLSQTSSQNTVINIVSSNGSAVSPDDYLPVNETITILAGQLTAGYPVEISIVDDTDPEANEVIVIISTVTSGAVTNPTIESFINIEDNDGGTSYPATGTLEVCGDENGLGAFDLNAMDQYFMEGGVAGTTTVTYHLTQADADADMNALVSPFVVDTVSIITIFVRITSPTGEVQISTLLCVVNPTPIAPDGLVFTQCDGNGDGIATFDLSQMDANIIQTQTELIVTYYLTETDADNNTNPIPNIYTNTSSPQNIFYRVEDINTGCYNVGNILLEVDPSC